MPGSPKSEHRGETLADVALEAVCEPPAGLSGAALECWQENAPHLAEIGALDRLSAPLFRIACLSYAQMVAAAEILDREGMITIGSRGGIKKHPAWSICNSAKQIFLLYAKDLGMTPASRHRIAKPKAGADVFEKFMNGKPQ